MNAIKRHPWRTAAIICAVVLIAALAWCLWPRSWSDIAGDGEISTFQTMLWEAAILEVDGEESHAHRSVKLSAEPEGGIPQGAEEILGLLDSARFRARPLYSLGTHSGGGGTITLSLVYDDQNGGVFYLDRNGILTGSDFNTTYSTDPELYDAIADVISRYGEAEERVIE